jgi:hypothetical protein
VLVGEGPERGDDVCGLHSHTILRVLSKRQEVFVPGAARRGEFMRRWWLPVEMPPGQRTAGVATTQTPLE